MVFLRSPERLRQDIQEIDSISQRALEEAVEERGLVEHMDVILTIASQMKAVGEGLSWFIDELNSVGLSEEQCIGAARIVLMKTNLDQDRKAWERLVSRRNRFACRSILGLLVKKS